MPLLRAGSLIRWLFSIPAQFVWGSAQSCPQVAQHMMRVLLACLALPHRCVADLMLQSAVIGQSAPNGIGTSNGTVVQFN